MPVDTRGDPGPDGGVRERILNAAMAILGDAGIQGLSQVQVARRADIRQSHLTYYFPRRHDLLDAVATRFTDGLLHDLQQVAGTAGGPAATLRRIADAIVDPAHMRMFTGVIVEADGDPELRSIMVRQTQRLQLALATLLGGDDATDHAALVLATLWGVGLHEFVVRPARRSTMMPTVLDWLAEKRKTAPKRRGRTPRRDG
jgi:AcrR family transcriptional regulator